MPTMLIRVNRKSASKSLKSTATAWQAALMGMKAAPMAVMMPLPVSLPSQPPVIARLSPHSVQRARFATSHLIQRSPARP